MWNVGTCERDGKHIQGVEDELSAVAMVAMIVTGSVYEDQVRAVAYGSEAADGPDKGFGGFARDVDFAVVPPQAAVLAAYMPRCGSGFIGSPFCEEGWISAIGFREMSLVAVGQGKEADRITASDEESCGTADGGFAVVGVCSNTKDVHDSLPWVAPFLWGDGVGAILGT